MELKKLINKRNILILIVILISCGVMLFYQTKKAGFHEDEAYTLSSSVSAKNGLMTAYKNNDLPENEPPAWKTKEDVKNYMTLTPNNYLNIVAIYKNQASDNHPPVFYTLVHFSTILFGGQFTKYSVFLVNIVAFILSCLVIKNILKLLGKEDIIIGTLILYGLSMGTISMVLYQRMYMTLTLFILLYFYYTIKLYKNDFELDKKLTIKLGITTILGFLTQYFFVFYAIVIFIMMIIKMAKEKKYKNIKKYVVTHIVCAIIGIVLFPPCIVHLLFSDRGISNLANSNYFSHFIAYVQHLAYAFSIKEKMFIIYIILTIVFIKITYSWKKTEERFIALLAIIPSAIFFLVNVQLTSWQELRYIMPMIPFMIFGFYYMIDTLIDRQYKQIIIIGLSIILVANGLIFSKPKFLYEGYSKCLQIAEDNSEKSFVYVYDNFFNHMQSIPEMMIYEKTLIVNYNKNELEYVINDEELNKENSYILCIKSYMNNEEIIEQIKEKTEFKNVKELYSQPTGTGSNEVENNLYLVSK